MITLSDQFEIFSSVFQINFKISKVFTIFAV